MQRVTVTLDDDLMAELDAMMEERGYPNRSEALRDLARIGLQQTKQEKGDGKPCVAAMIYTYDHSKRHLPGKLTDNFHDHHDLSRATLHVHIDHDRCLEVAILSGKPASVQHMADHVFAERGVQYGRLVMIPAKT
jgi:CopG family nickel-responsive transcriptional regulator